MTVTILLGHQRSGTGALGSAFNQHPSLQYLGEVFHPGGQEFDENYFSFIKSKLPVNPSILLPDYTKKRFDEYLNFIEERATKFIPIIDVKYDALHHFQDYSWELYSEPNFLRFSNNRGLKIIHLTRKNLLDVFVSLCFAVENKIWHMHDRSELTVLQLVLDIEFMIRFLDQKSFEVEQVLRYLSRYKEVTTVDYETLFGSDGKLEPAASETLFNFLEVPFIPVQPLLKKQVDRPLSEVVQNYDDVVKTLTGTRYESMLR